MALPEEVRRAQIFMLKARELFAESLGQSGQS